MQVKVKLHICSKLSQIIQSLLFVHLCCWTEPYIHNRDFPCQVKYRKVAGKIQPMSEHLPISGFSQYACVCNWLSQFLIFTNDCSWVRSKTSKKPIASRKNAVVKLRNLEIRYDLQLQRRINYFSLEFNLNQWCTLPIIFLLITFPVLLYPKVANVFFGLLLLLFHLVPKGDVPKRAEPDWKITSGKFGLYKQTWTGPYCHRFHQTVKSIIFFVYLIKSVPETSQYDTCFSNEKWNCFENISLSQTIRFIK